MTLRRRTATPEERAGVRRQRTKDGGGRMRGTRTFLGMMALAVLLLVGGSAFAKPLRFMGPHPVAASLGGGYCYIEGPHFHGYAPDHGTLYAHVDGGLVFAGDPTPFGYDGPHFQF